MLCACFNRYWLVFQRRTFKVWTEESLGTLTSGLTFYIDMDSLMKAVQYLSIIAECETHLCSPLLLMHVGNDLPLGISFDAGKFVHC